MVWYPAGAASSRSFLLFLRRLKRQQSFFVGIRSAFYFIANIMAQGFLVMVAGRLQIETGDARPGWMIALGALTVLLLVFGVDHAFILPKPAADLLGSSSAIPGFIRQFFATFGSYFRRPKIAIILLFRLCIDWGRHTG